MEHQLFLLLQILLNEYATKFSYDKNSLMNSEVGRNTDQLSSIFVWKWDTLEMRLYIWIHCKTMKKFDIPHNCKCMNRIA